MVSKLAFIHPDAKIGKDVIVEPFAYIAGNVVIGDGTWVGPNSTIMDGARIGKNCKIFPSSVISGIPQDLKFVGEYSTVEIVSLIDLSFHSKNFGYLAINTAKL